VLGRGKLLELRDAPVSPVSEPVALSEERPGLDEHRREKQRLVEHRPEPVAYAPWSPLSEPVAACLADRLVLADESESRGRRREPRPQLGQRPRGPQLGQEPASSAEPRVSARPGQEPAVRRCSSEWSLPLLEPAQPAVPLAEFPRELVVCQQLTCRCQIRQPAPPSFRSPIAPAAIAWVVEAAVDPTQAQRRGPDRAVAGRWKLLMLTSLQCEVPVAQTRLRVDRQSGAADVAASTGSALIWAEPVVAVWVGPPELQHPYAGPLPALHGNPCLAHWNS
jgi:hypothetical protein